jgi:hypothetical protein
MPFWQFGEVLTSEKISLIRRTDLQDLQLPTQPPRPGTRPGPRGGTCCNSFVMLFAWCQRWWQLRVASPVLISSFPSLCNHESTASVLWLASVSKGRATPCLWCLLVAPEFKTILAQSTDPTVVPRTTSGRRETKKKFIMVYPHRYIYMGWSSMPKMD